MKRGASTKIKQKAFYTKQNNVKKIKHHRLFSPYGGKTHCSVHRPVMMGGGGGGGGNKQLLIISTAKGRDKKSTTEFPAHSRPRLMSVFT